MSINNVTLDNMNDWLDYHPPTPDQIHYLQCVREAAKTLAEAILENCPDSADRSFALRQLKLALMSANQSIILENVT